MYREERTTTATTIIVVAAAAARTLKKETVNPVNWIYWFGHFGAADRLRCQQLHEYSSI